MDVNIDKINIEPCTLMADTPNPGIASLEMLLERLSAIESHTRIATAFRQYDAEAMPAGS